MRYHSNSITQTSISVAVGMNMNFLSLTWTRLITYSPASMSASPASLLLSFLCRIQSFLKTNSNNHSLTSRGRPASQNTNSKEVH